MKTFACIVALALISLLSTSEAAVSYGLAEVDPSSPNKCVWTEYGTRTLHSVGSSWTITGCSEARCGRQDGKLYVYITSCLPMPVNPPCRMGQIDPSKPYPQCCAQPTCPTD